MDSTPANTSASKLPLKRKASDSIVDPNNSFPPIIIPPPSKQDSDYSIITSGGADPRPPPFKFHRIWTEPDEIRFLQGLLDCGSEKLSFPKDLNVFYARFSNTMSQPYTRSQLSEKLRRLRKKYRVITTRLSKGLDQSFLSPHDRALYELSKQLWHPDYAQTSPFCPTSIIKTNNLEFFRDTVEIFPAFSVDFDHNLVENFENFDSDYYLDGGFENVGFDGEEGRLSEVNVEFEEEGLGEAKLPGPIGVGNGMGGEEKFPGRIGVENGIGGVAVKAVVDVFDESLKEVRMGFGSSVKDEGNGWCFQKRWREQRFVEMEALGRRMRLVVEDSLLRMQGI